MGPVSENCKERKHSLSSSGEPIVWVQTPLVHINRELHEWIKWLALEPSASAKDVLAVSSNLMLPTIIIIMLKTGSD